MCRISIEKTAFGKFTLGNLVLFYYIQKKKRKIISTAKKRLLNFAEHCIMSLINWLT